MAKINFRFAQREFANDIEIAFYSTQKTYFVCYSHHIEGYELYEHLGSDLIRFVRVLENYEFKYLKSIPKNKFFFFFERNHKKMNDKELKEKYNKNCYRLVVMDEGKIYYPISMQQEEDSLLSQLDLQIIDFSTEDPEACKDLDDILDKINQEGMENLKLQEIEYLKNNNEKKTE